jgi:hypothetical protein
MAVKLNSDFAKEQKSWVKRAMKGRPLYFGLQAQAAKKGKFVVSRKPGDVKPNSVKELEVYEGDGKDKEKAAEKNTIPGAAAMGVCQGENGTLKLYFERGRAVPAAERFVKYFVTREVKCKLVKRVQIAEVEQLPAVPDKDAGDAQPATAAAVEARVKELAQRSKAAGGDAYGLPERLKQALALAKTDAGTADDALDDVEYVIGTLERAKALQDRLKGTAAEPGVAKEPVAAIAKQIASALGLVKSGDVDGADEALDTAEQSLANLRQTAGLGASDMAAPVSTEAPKIDDGQAGEFFKDWLEGIKPDLKTLKDAGTPELKEIGEHVKAVSTAVGKKDWKGAADAYKRADALLTAAIASLRKGGAASTIETSNAEFRVVWDKGIAQLRRSLGEVESELESLADTLVETDDDDLYWVASDGLPDLLRSLRAAANELLRVKAGTPGRTAALARPLMRNLRGVLQDQRVAACDDNEFGVTTRIRGRVEGALELLESGLDGVR